MPSFTVQLADLQQLGPVVQVRIGVGAALEEMLRQAGQPVQRLIGRDVLSQAVFIYTGYNHSFTLCF